MDRRQIEADFRHQCRSTMVTFRNHGPNVTLYLENFAHSEPVPSGRAEMKQFMPFPDSNRAPLAGQHFQVAVVGGGILGVAIARECARAGKRTLLVEQHDFAGGTTSRSTRILSGLRPLERGDIAFARETLREKEQLLRERPHLAHPSHFLMALSEEGNRSAMSARTGLWLYRRMTGR